MSVIRCVKLMPKRERNMLEFGELPNGGQRLSNERTAAPAIVDLLESRAWRKYIDFSPTGSDANIDADGGVALMPLLDSAVNEKSSLANDMLYSCLLNGCQTKAARGSGLGDGGIRNRTGTTFD
jgi:hypothetical protein